MWARNDNGRCAEFISFDPIDKFHPDIPWVEVPEALKPWANDSYVIVDGTVAPPSLDYLAGQIIERIKERRWQEQVKGVMHEGNRWHTDSEGRRSITDSLTLATEFEAATGAAWSAKWQTMDAIVTVDRAALVSAGLVVGGHVAACFERAAEIIDLVNLALADPATTAADLVAIYNTEIDQGWPA